jgi:ubiquinone/menaquinone biosynthesis C-methylase UbiE
MMRRSATVGVVDTVRHVEDLARLLAQGERYRMEAELLFDRIGVGSGWHALDLSYGPLGVLDVLAERVGPRGHVIGVDTDPAMLAATRDVLNARAISGVELARGDLTHIDVPASSFDLVHERLMLGCLAEPRATVREMARVARSGGWVALQDADLASWTCEPASPAWDRLAHVLERASTGDPRTGRHLPQLLRHAGLSEIEVDAHAGVWAHDDPRRSLLQYLVRVHRDRILADGTIRAAELDETLAVVGEHLARPGTMVMGWTLFQAWGRKPAAR